MLISVEGGFISSSASGCSKDLTFLLYGIGGIGGSGGRGRIRVWRDDNPMRVFSWNQNYRLVSQEDIIAEYPLAPAEHRARTRRVCRPFFCFRGPPPPGLDGPPSPLKVEPVVPQEECLSTSPSGGIAEEADGVGELGVKAFQKSSLKKPLTGRDDDCGEAAAKEVEGESNQRSVLGTAAKRKVQWTDGCGRDLTEIREFEPSELNESGDEDDGRGCSCVIQ
ncbi:unnamed protein product [Victoria cruziana]